MKREPTARITKLIDVAARDYPNASEILVSFPDQWEFVNTLKQEGRQIYVAAFPLERARTSRDHFYGLVPEINVSLVFYRLYKFFQPWPMPRLTVEWNPSRARGRVTGIHDFHLQLQPIGQAQAWFGVNHAVLWEAYLNETRREGNWQETLADVWKMLEHDLQVPKILTAPHEPTFEEGYTEFLSKLGYTIDPDNPDWWSKDTRVK